MPDLVNSAALQSLGFETQDDLFIDRLDYTYVNNCHDLDELVELYTALKTGEYGYYPDLKEKIEIKIHKINPNHKVLKEFSPPPKKPIYNPELTDTFNSWLNNFIPENVDEIIAEAETAKKNEVSNLKGKFLGDDSHMNKLKILDPSSYLRHSEVRTRGKMEIKNFKVRYSESLAEGDKSGEENLVEKVQKSNSPKKLSSARKTYRNWDKFDADKALKEIDSNSESEIKSTTTSSSDYEEIGLEDFKKSFENQDLKEQNFKELLIKMKATKDADVDEYRAMEKEFKKANLLREQEENQAKLNEDSIKDDQSNSQKPKIEKPKLQSKSSTDDHTYDSDTEINDHIKELKNFLHQDEEENEIRLKMLENREEIISKFCQQVADGKTEQFVTDPTNPNAKTPEELMKALQEARDKSKSLNEKSKQLSEMFKRKGNKYMIDKRFEDSKLAYSKAIGLWKENVPAINNRAQANLKLGFYEDAIDDCSTVLKYEDKNIKALLRRAEAYLNEGSKTQDLQYYHLAKVDIDVVEEVDALNGKSSRKDVARLRQKIDERLVERMNNKDIRIPSSSSDEELIIPNKSLSSLMSRMKSENSGLTLDSDDDSS